MDGVDRNDLICNYMSVRKTSTWTIKVVIHFTEEAVLNVFILYNKQFSGKIRLMNYKMEAIERFLQCASAKPLKGFFNVPVQQMRQTPTQRLVKTLRLIPLTEKNQTP